MAGIGGQHEGLGRRFWTLAGASGVSNLADGAFKIALPLVAVTFSRSPALVAGVEVARSLPWLVVALQAGAYVDRWDRRRTMLAANTVRGLALAALALVIVSGIGGLPALYTVALVTGVAEVFHDTAAQTILPALVPRGQLARANGRLYAVEFGMQQLAGPPVGGLLVATGLAIAFWVPAGLWLVGVGALSLLRGSFSTVREGPPTTIRTDVREGVAFLRNHELLRTLAIMVGVTNLASSAGAAIVVLFAVGEGSALGLSESGFGGILVALAVGGLLGSLVAATIEARLGRARTITLSLVLMTTFLAAPAVTTNVTAIVVLLFIGGVGVMLWNIPTVSFRQEVTPDHLLGRVNSAYRMLAWGALPVGALVGGLLAEVIGIRPVFAVMALLSLAMLVPNRRITDLALAAAVQDAEVARTQRAANPTTKA